MTYVRELRRGENLMQLGREVCLRLLVHRKLVHGKFGEIAVGVIRATRGHSIAVHGRS